MTPEEELKQLVREQQRDMRRGSFQRNEPGVLHLSAIATEHLTNQGMSVRAKQELNKVFPEFCLIHGPGDHMVKSPPSWQARGRMWLCKKCGSEANLRWRTLNKEKERERIKEWKMRNPEKVKAQAKRHRKRHENDWEWYARNRKAKREHMQRKRKKEQA